MMTLHSALLQANTCLIDRQCFSMGEMNPENNCLRCDPSEYDKAWYYGRYSINVNREFVTYY